jgi:hypothetical protein
LILKLSKPKLSHSKLGFVYVIVDLLVGILNPTLNDSVEVIIYLVWRELNNCMWFGASLSLEEILSSKIL